MPLALILVLWGLLLVSAVNKPAAAPAIENAPLEPSWSRPSFRAEFLRQAQDVNWQGLDVKAALAWASLESGDGQGNVFRHTRNLFSLTKGSWWTGPTYRAATGLEFRVYADWQASMRDIVILLHRPYYLTALVKMLAGDVNGFFHELKRLGYDASEPRYAELLMTRYQEVV